jgi:hypothetical protein
MIEFKSFLEILEKNRDVLFSGLGTAIVTFILTYLFLNQSTSKKKQQIGKHAFGIQGAGDVSVKNLTVNMSPTNSLADLKEVCLIVFNENFPRLRQEAYASAKSNVDKLIPLIDKKISDHLANIDLCRLTDPDIQSSLNDAVQAAALKGDKIDIDLLGELIATRLRTDSSDFLSIVAQECIQILPKLTARQLAFITLSVGLSVRRSSPPITSIKELEEDATVLLPFVEKGFGLLRSEKLHMISLGVAINQIFAYEGKWATLTKIFAFLNSIPNPIDAVRSEAPNYSLILDKYKEVENLELTAAGKLIGCILLAKAFPSFDPLITFSIFDNDNR